MVIIKRMFRNVIDFLLYVLQILETCLSKALIVFRPTKGMKNIDTKDCSRAFQTFVCTRLK